MPKVGDIYKHYKGETYEIISISRHTETGEVFITYKPISYESDWLKENSCDSFTRPLDMFIENIERDGYSGPRFVKIENKG